MLVVSATKSAHVVPASVDFSILNPVSAAPVGFVQLISMATSEADTAVTVGGNGFVGIGVEALDIAPSPTALTALTL